MRKLKYFLIGFKNAFIKDTSEIRKDYPIYELWRKSNKIDDKFKVIDEKTKENITKHIY